MITGYKHDIVVRDVSGLGHGQYYMIKKKKMTNIYFIYKHLSKSFPVGISHLILFYLNLMSQSYIQFIFVAYLFD